MASAGESTYSSTLWQSTRSALASPATVARSATSPWTTLSGTFSSAARRSAAASESGLGSITVTLWPRPASGTANPPAAARVEDVEAGPADLRRERGDHRPEDVADDRGARVVVPAPGPGRRAHGATAGWRTRTAGAVQRARGATVACHCQPPCLRWHQCSAAHGHPRGAGSP